MDSVDYIHSIKEQLRAYDFEEVNIIEQSGYLCFRREKSRIVRDQEEVVFIAGLESVSVDELKSHLNDVIEAGEAVFSEEGTLTVRHLYFVAVTNSASRALRVATERGSDSFSLNDSVGGFFLPVLIDLEESRLKYGDVSMKHRVTHFTEMKKNAEDYFSL